MSESGDQLFNDLTNTPPSSHQTPGKKRPSRRVSFIETNTMSESGDELFNGLPNTPQSPHQEPGKKRPSRRVSFDDLTNTPPSSHQTPGKKRHSGRARTPSRPYSPSTEKGVKTKIKENWTKLVTGEVRATRNPFPQYVAAEADAGGVLKRKIKIAPRKEHWVIPPMSDSILDAKMKFLPQIQNSAQAAQAEEEQEETRQHQGEEESLSMVKVEGEEEISLIEPFVEDDEEPLTVAFRKKKELEQKIKTMEMQKARAERRKQAYIEELCALKRNMVKMMEAKAKDLRRSL